MGAAGVNGPGRVVPFCALPTTFYPTLFFSNSSSFHLSTHTMLEARLAQASTLKKLLDGTFLRSLDGSLLLPPSLLVTRVAFCPPPVLTSLASPLGLAPSQLSRSSSRTPTSSATMMESCVPPRRLPLASRSQTDTSACLEKRVRSDPCRPSKPWTTLTSPSSRSSSRRVALRAIDATEACPWVSMYVWWSPSPSDHLPPPRALRLISSRPHHPLTVGLAHQDPQVRQGRRRRHPEGCR